MFKGWILHVHREFPGKFKPANLGRENLTREILSGRLTRRGGWQEGGYEFWVLGFGFWVSGFGFWDCVLGLGFGFGGR